MKTKLFLFCIGLCTAIEVIASNTVVGTLHARSEVVGYSYIGEDGPSDQAVYIGADCHETNQKYRRISYDGHFFWQSWFLLRLENWYFEVGGARQYNPITGLIDEDPYVQYHEVLMGGCPYSTGSPYEPSVFSGTYPSGYRNMGQRTTFPVGYAGNGICILDEDGVGYENGEPGYTLWYEDAITITYSDPDTTADAIARAIHNGDQWTDSGESYHRQTSGNEFAKSQGFYSASFPQGCGLVKVTFKIKKLLCDDYWAYPPVAPSVSTRSVVLNLDKKQQTPEFKLPIEDGYVVWVDEEVIATPVTCGSCNGTSGTPGMGGGPTASSVSWDISLGENANGESFGILQLYSETVEASLGIQTSLEFVEGLASTQAVEVSGFDRRQFRTENITADLQAVDASSYKISFYWNTDVGDADPDGFYQFTDNPYVFWTVDFSPGEEDQKELLVSKIYNGVTQTFKFTEDPTPLEGERSLIFEEGGIRFIEKVYSTDPNDASLAIVETVVKESDGTIVTRRMERFTELPWGKVLVEEVLAPDTENILTVWEYDITSDYDYDLDLYTDRLYMASETRPDGAIMEVYNADPGYNKGAYSVLMNPDWDYLEIDGNQKGTYLYNIDPQPEGVVYADFSIHYDPVTYEGIRSSRVYTWRKGVPTDIDGVLYYESEMQEVACVGEDNYIWNFEDPGSWTAHKWDDPSNQITLEREYADGEFFGELAWRLNPSGILETWNYSLDEITGSLEKVYSRGEPDEENTSVIDGIRETTITNAFGNVIFKSTVDIASGIVISESDVIEVDAGGRPLQIVHLDGSVEVRTYSPCCDKIATITRHGKTIEYQYDAIGRLWKETKDGLTFEHQYDADDRLKKIIRHGSDDSQMVILEQVYNLAGQLISRSKNGAQPTTFEITYPGDGTTVKTTTYPDGGTLVEMTNADGSLASRTGTAVRDVTYEYSASGDHYTEDDVLAVVKESYSGTQWVQTYEDMFGRTHQVEYPASDGSVATVSHQYAYLENGLPGSDTDPDGVHRMYGYDSQGSQTIIAVDLAEGGDGNEAIDFEGTDTITETLASYVNRDGTDVRRTITSRWETDNADFKTEISRVDESLDGFRTWITQMGATTEVLREPDFDGAGGLRETTTFADGTQSVVITSNSRLAQSTLKDTEGTVLTQVDYEYDAHGRLWTETVFNIGTTTYAYHDGSDLVKKVTSADPDLAREGDGYDPQVTEFTYDEMGRQNKVIHPDLTETHTRYGPTGAVFRTWGSRQYPVEYHYTEAGEVSEMRTWQAFVDESSFTDGTSYVATTWHYNSYRGWLEKKTYDGSPTGTEWTYTDAGRLETRTNERGILTTFTYTAAGNLDTVTYSDGTDTIDYGYDRALRNDVITDASGTRYLGYAGDLPTTVSYASGPFQYAMTARGYDDENRLHQVKLSLPGMSDRVATYGYDDKTGRLDSVSVGSYSFGYAYDASRGMIDKLTSKNDAVDVLIAEREYDTIGRLEKIDTTFGSQLRSFGYTYNSANQRTRLTFADGRYWEYGYDALGQVDSAILKNAAETAFPGRSYGFSFDTIGNRTETSIDTHAFAYTPDDLNQYEQREVGAFFGVAGSAASTAAVTVNSVQATRLGEYFYSEVPADNSTSPVWDAATIEATIAGGGHAGTDAIAEQAGAYFVAKNPEAYAYDDDGNLTSDGRWTYTWNGENRLKSLQSQPAAVSAGAPDLLIEFRYDSQGRRFEKKVTETIGGVTQESVIHRYLYDGWNLIAILDHEGKLLQDFVWGLDLSGSFQGTGGVGGLLLVRDSATGVAATPFYDGNGNVMGYVDMKTESSVAEFEYGPFGETIMETGPLVDVFAFRFSTKITDEETGLLYYGFRYYDAETGRWVSRDPLGEPGHDLVAELFDTTGVGQEDKITPPNLYNFAFNDGINYYDVNGEWVAPALRGAGAAAGAIGRWWAKRKAKQAAECAAIHAAYDAAAKQAAGCKPCLTCPEYVKLLTARAAEIGGRALYLKKKCDYKLPGSIARGSKKAEAGHRKQLADKVKAFGNCAAHAAKQNCGNLPQLPNF